MSIHAQIICAGDNELPDLVDGPDMRDAIVGNCRPMLLKIVSLTPGDGGDAVEKTRSFPSSGFLVATDARKLDIKADGDGTRKWKFWNLFLLDDPRAEVGDKFVIKGTLYKIVKSNDFTQFGFAKFGLQEDFQTKQ